MSNKQPPELPSTEEVKQAIESFLKNEDWSRHTDVEGADEFLERMRTRLGVLARSFVLLIRPNIPPTGQRFYRLRLSKTPLNEGLLSEYGPPPIDRAGFDRCSIIGHPVMYCSANRATTFQETLFVATETAPLQYGYLSEWKVREGCKVHMTPFVFSELPETSELHPMVAFARAAVRKQLATQYSPGQINGVLETMEYLSQLFLNDTAKSISSFIAHSHLYANNPARPDIFLYPSIQANRLRANFAIQPNSLHKMELVKVYVCEISDFEPIEKHFNITWTIAKENHDGVLDRRLINLEDDATLSLKLLEDFQGMP